VQAAWCVIDSKADWRKRLNLVTGALLLLGTLTGVALVSGYGDALLKRFADVGSSDRLTLDDRNMRWREDQADAAFSMMKDSADWIVGIGPTATVPLSHGTMNELHFGYHSVLWTFGLVGLSLLVLTLLHTLAGAFVGPRKRAYIREAALATIFMAITGAYTGVFTVPDCAIVLALAAGYLWVPRFAGDAARSEQSSPQPAEPGRPSQAPLAEQKSRRWSAQVRRGHATP